MIKLQGCADAIGRVYGGTCREPILSNLKELVDRQGYEPLPRRDRDFQAWVRGQEALIGQHWPWLLEEMRGVAAGCGAVYEDILLLNLRAWQYDYYGKPPGVSCSSVAITLADGTVACAGALDDPRKYYCGPVHVVPDRGHRFITFPITGTSWGNRGMNSAGLVTGISSQLLPGLKLLPHAVDQDLALRVILQTCATVGEVREFCREFPFTMNLVCVDARGGLFCAQQTAAGLFELPVTDGWCALTNHVADDGIMRRLAELGVKEFPESPTTRARRGRLIEFCRARSRACPAEEVRKLIGRRDDADPGTIHNKGTIAITFAVPQADPLTLRVALPDGREANPGFTALSI